MKVTQHCRDRINGRLKELLTINEVLTHPEIHPYPNTRMHIVIKTFPRKIVIDEGKRKHNPMGDSLVAIIEDDRVITILLRGKNQKSDRYQNRRIAA